ncbi:MAG: hypothetical protein ACI9LV_000840 [Candidatus Nanohaloarchaea archaeon]|jgi:hypothetical protein
MDEGKIDELIEQKVEEKTRKLKKKVEKLEQEKRELKQKNSETDNKIDRRKFLKLAGLGAGGLAFSSLGTSWFSVNQNTGGGSSTLSEVLSNGNNVNNQDIVDNGTTIWNTNQQQIPSNQIQTSGLNADQIDGQDFSDIQNWVNNNADVPNADDADTLQGKSPGELGASQTETASQNVGWDWHTAGTTIQINVDDGQTITRTVDKTFPGTGFRVEISKSTNAIIDSVQITTTNNTYSYSSTGNYEEYFDYQIIEKVEMTVSYPSRSYAASGSASLNFGVQHAGIVEHSHNI